MSTPCYRTGTNLWKSPLRWDILGVVCGYAYFAYQGRSKIWEHLLKKLNAQERNQCASSRLSCRNSGYYAPTCLNPVQSLEVRH